MAALQPFGNGKVKELIEAFGVEYDNLMYFRLEIQPAEIVTIDCTYVVEEQKIGDVVKVINKKFEVHLIEEKEDNVNV